MSGELAALAAEVMPYASAAAAAYGGAALSKARDEAADATVSMDDLEAQKAALDTPVSLAYTPPEQLRAPTGTRA